MFRQEIQQAQVNFIVEIMRIFKVYLGQVASFLSTIIILQWFCCRGSRCGGCRRVNDPDRPHAFEVRSDLGRSLSFGTTLLVGSFY